MKRKRIIVDPGRRFVKAARIDTGEVEIVTISSVAGIGEAEVGQLSLGEGMPRPSLPNPYQVKVNGLTRLVGEGTQRYTRPTEGLNLLWAHDGPLVKALLYATIYRLLGPGEHDVELYLAAPVVHHTADSPVERLMSTVSDYADTLKRWGGGRHTFEVDGECISLHVSNIRALPDALGALATKGLDSEGWMSDSTALLGKTAVLDVGYFNTALTVFADGDLKFQLIHDCGTSLIASALQTQVERRHDRLLSLFQADELLYTATPHVRTTHDEIDLTKIVDQLRSALATHLFTFAETHIANCDYVLLTGGGVSLVAKELLSVHRKTVLMNEPITAIIRGLVKYTKRKRRKDK